MITYPYVREIVAKKGKLDGMDDNGTSRCLDGNLKEATDKKGEILKKGPICLSSQKNFENLPFTQKSGCDEDLDGLKKCFGQIMSHPSKKEENLCAVCEDLEENNRKIYGRESNIFAVVSKSKSCPKLKKDSRKNLESECGVFDQGAGDYQTTTKLSHGKIDVKPYCPVERPKAELGVELFSHCPMEKWSVTNEHFRYDPKEVEPCVRLGNSTKDVWAREQLAQKFTKDTTHKTHFDEKKLDEKTRPIIYCDNLEICKGKVNYETENRSAFSPGKVCDRAKIPVVNNDELCHVTDPMESCTTHKHFFVPHCIPDYTMKCSFESRKAFPFSTTHNMCYSGVDPILETEEPVKCPPRSKCPTLEELQCGYLVERTEPFRPKDMDNLKIDPCAPMRLETTYKSDYEGIDACFRPCSKSFAPILGYKKPYYPFSDSCDTTMNSDYHQYNECEYKYSKVCPANPQMMCGAPYDRPELEPCGCPPLPCSFDDRTSYRKNFQKWTDYKPYQKEKNYNEEFPQPFQVPKGTTLYRFGYTSPRGHVMSEKIPPPESKGHRAINPSQWRIKDTIYQKDFRNYWDEMDRDTLNAYRGSYKFCDPNQKQILEPNPQNEMYNVQIYIDENPNDGENAVKSDSKISLENTGKDASAGNDKCDIDVKDEGGKTKDDADKSTTTDEEKPPPKADQNSDSDNLNRSGKITDISKMQNIG